MEKFKAVAYFTSGEIKEVELSRKDWFAEAKEVLGIGTADIVDRKIGGVRFTFLCDDEGALVADAKISAVDKHGYAMLFGDLLIMHNAPVDLGGTTIVEDITDEEKTIIAQSVRVFYTSPVGFVPIICGGEYV